MLIAFSIAFLILMPFVCFLMTIPEYARYAMIADLKAFLYIVEKTAARNDVAKMRAACVAASDKCFMGVNTMALIDAQNKVEMDAILVRAWNEAAFQLSKARAFNPAEVLRVAIGYGVPSYILYVHGFSSLWVGIPMVLSLLATTARFFLKRMKRAKVISHFQAAPDALQSVYNTLLAIRQ